MTVKTGQRKGNEIDEADKEEVNLYKENERILAKEVRENAVDSIPGKVLQRVGEVSEEKRKTHAQYEREQESRSRHMMSERGGEAICTGPTMVFRSRFLHVPKLTFIYLLLKNEAQDIPYVLMIRERVDIRGQVRAMEPKEDIEALQMSPSQIGIIKERPVRRWAEGQNAQDKKFRHTAEKVIKKRKKLEERAKKMLADAREQGLLLENDSIHRKEQEIQSAKNRGAKRANSDGESVFSATVSRRIDDDRRWGPLDLANEKPPPTAIAARRDTVCSVFHILFIILCYLVLIELYSQRPWRC